MLILDEKIKSQILQEVEAFIKKEKTYNSYILCMDDLTIWLQKKAK